jgi:ribosomal protein S18 acetylase RimI-like enzyme
MLPVGFELLAMTVGDYDEVVALWNACEGVRAGETREEFTLILARNPQLSTVIRCGTQLAAAVLCCHDGRRGYLYHVCVASEFRKLGLGRVLVDRSLAKLKEVGISRCTIFVIAGNEAGEAFWKRTGWRERDDLKMFAREL